MKRCNLCVMPEVRGHIVFDEKGVCNICKKYVETSKDNDTWAERGFDELKKEIENKKNKKGDYDCIVAVSGGKDSIMTLYIAKIQLELNPLVVFIDNGFSLDEMFHNINLATDILGVDVVIYKTQKFKEIFRYLLLKKKPIYYCRLCHSLIDVYVREIAVKNNISLLLGGYTRGQDYVKQDELFWIYDISDKNVIKELSATSNFYKELQIFDNLAVYLYKNFDSITTVNPFQFLKYEEKKIIDFLTKELDFRLLETSWPNHSTNCQFNFVSQYLNVKNFGYTQHETELSTLVRKKEMNRKRALEIISAPIQKDDLDIALQKLDLTYNDII